MHLKVFISSFNNKFIYIKKSFGKQPFRLLDIGTGNHSATKTKSVFHNCEYYGVDIKKDYNNSENDFSLMKEFYEMDLTELEFSSIPDNYFDGIWIAHVIEHLYNGDEVIQKLFHKLKTGGYMYLEYPGSKSMKLPSMYGSLNFNDDPTHARLYSIKELSKIFNSNNFKILKSGTRRNGWFLMAMPFRIIGYILKGKKIPGNVFWDALGFAEFIWVKKNSSNFSQ
jgi:ubiquinone/menaquinone biosynthesis C-methylase UbiE